MSLASTTKLNPESHLLLDQPLLRLPHEVLRKNFKTSQKHVERDTQALLQTARDAAHKAVNATSSSGEDGEIPIDVAEAMSTDSLAQIDLMISRMQGLKRKMETLHEEEKQLHEQSRKRISHLNDLYSIPSLVDESYDRWSKTRLDRLLVDFLLRSGYGESAKQLAKEKEIMDLVDIDVFVQCWKIEDSLRNRSTAECLAWCNENKTTLKKNKSTLEFELRLQQFIELVREGKKIDAAQHSKKHLHSHFEAHQEELYRASALLAFPPVTRLQPYRDLLSDSRWEHLAKSFVTTHHNLYSLPSRPLLHIALSAGLSSLKTPACHSAVASSSSNAASSATSLCPICSTELNELARNVPYAHHTRSWVENDPVVLPNGRIYGRKKLEELSSKIGLAAGKIRDPTTGEEWEETQIRKVYIS